MYECDRVCVCLYVLCCVLEACMFINVCARCFLFVNARL